MIFLVYCVYCVFLNNWLMLLRGEKSRACPDSFRIPESALYAHDVYIACLCLVVIGLEKKEKEFRLSIHGFDKAQLAPTETQEKNPLPPQEGLCRFWYNCFRLALSKLTP